VGAPKPAGLAWDAPGNAVLGRAGGRIALPESTRAPAIEVSLDGNDTYLIVFAHGDTALDEQRVGPRGGPDGLAIYRLAVPAAAAASGYTHIQVTPLGGDARYSLGHLRLLP
jgi:hypothetical protein